MKLSLLTILLIPFLSFGQEVIQNTDQISRKDKKSIDENILSMCECVSEKVNSIHPKTIKVVMLIAEKGEAEAMAEVEAMMEAMEPEELQAFMESFSVLESSEFRQDIDVCDHVSKLSTELQDQINNNQGPAYDYFMEVLGREDACKFMKYAYELGASSDE